MSPRKRPRMRWASSSNSWRYEALNWGTNSPRDIWKTRERSTADLADERVELLLLDGDAEVGRRRTPVPGSVAVAPVSRKASTVAAA